MTAYARMFALAFDPVDTDTVRVARGDTLLDDGNTILPSPLPGVSDEAWTAYACLMITAKPDAVSASNALGMFEMMPRRLFDLGIVRNLKRTRGPSGRMIWCADFVPPMTSKKFLRNPTVQLRAFATSMRDYFDEVAARPDGMSRSSALAILHRAGPEGLKSWAAGKRFEMTTKLANAVEGVF